jgi:uncharacterized membrane protein
MATQPKSEQGHFCSSCGAQVAETATFCATCGRPIAASGAPGSAPAAGMTDNVAGMLAYVTIIPAILFLVLEPYNRRPFIRFHAFQCIFFAVALTVIHIGFWFIPLLGWLINVLVSLTAFVLWVVLLVKAYQGKMFKLPIIGDMAAKQANAM